MQTAQAAIQRRGIRWILPLSAFLLATAVVAPPLISLNGFHGRIADSIAQAIGRPVHMSSITMRLLPRPGFQIADFVVEEDPGFGAEPILRSSQVAASVRLLPLWRGRLEIARIAFDEPSLNLVRNRAGRWNFDSLLSQAAQVPKAPTAERHPGGLPRFPYIDATNARINFKSGDEKLPFSFLNADLAVWLENPGEWRIEFAAQPVRTDLSLDLANTGVVRLNGSLRHAAALTQMPLQLHAEWSNAPLGQLSRMFTGSDADWRGRLDAAADITGNVDHAVLKLTASGQGVHRAEFEPRQPLNLNVACNARFSRLDSSDRPGSSNRLIRFFDAATCLAPIGDGHLLLTGSIHAIPGKPEPALSLTIDNVPVAAALDGIRLFRSSFGATVVAAGAIDGNFTYSANRPSPSGLPETASSLPVPPVVAQPMLEGQATVNRLTVAGPASETPLVLPTLHFSVTAPSPSLGNPRRGRAASSPPAKFQGVANQILLLEPFTIETTTSPTAPAAAPTGGPTTSLPALATIGGAFDWSGFSIHIAGQSHPAALIALGKGFGVLHDLRADLGSQGTADLDLTIHGQWVLPVADPDQPVAPAAVDGSLRLRNAQLTASFLAQPLRIPAAQALFAGNRVDWTAPAMTYGPLHADGTLTYPAFCGSPTGCVPSFTLHMAALDAATAQSALLGAPRHGAIVQDLIDRIRSLDQTSPSWPTLTGTIQIETLTVQDLALRDFAANLAVEGRTIQVKSSSARALDGQFHLTGAMEATGNAPRYELRVEIDNATAPAAAALFDERWGPGSIDLQTSLKFSGFEEKELLSSATGTFHWEWNHGALPFDQPTAPANPVLGHFDSWTADGTIAGNALTLEKSTIASETQPAVPLTGSITFKREFNFASPDRNGPTKLAGTLPHPESATPKAAPNPQAKP